MTVYPYPSNMVIKWCKHSIACYRSFSMQYYLLSFMIVTPPILTHGICSCQNGRFHSLGISSPRIPQRRHTGQSSRHMVKDKSDDLRHIEDHKGFSRHIGTRNSEYNDHTQVLELL